MSWKTSKFINRLVAFLCAGIGGTMLLAAPFWWSWVSDDPSYLTSRALKVDVAFTMLNGALLMLLGLIAAQQD